MAQNTNVRSTYGLVGIREDLSDMIYRIDPWTTPFIAMIGRTKTDGPYTEWQTESLDAVDLNNAVIEGEANPPNDTISNRVRVGNRTQKLDKVIEISDRAEATKKAGINSLLGHELAKKGLALRKDVEAIVLNNQASVVGSDTVPSKLGSLPAWLTSNVSRGATGANGGFSSGNVNAATDGTLRALSWQYVKDMLTAQYNSGADPKILMMTAAQKVGVSTFLFGATGTARIAQVTMDYKDSGGEQAKAIAAFDAYRSDFGELAMVPNRNQRTRDLFLLNPEFLDMAELIPFKEVNLPDGGHSIRRLIKTELTLRVLHQGAQGIIADLDPSLAVVA